MENKQENQENMEEYLQAFGTASVQPEFEGYKIFKLKTPDAKKGETITTLILRLLPQMHSLKADPTGWRRFYGNHYGHYGNNARNPEKPRPRPFGCIQKKNLKTKEIERHCPKCDQMEIKRGKQAKREREIETANPHIAKIENDTDRKRALRELCKKDKDWMVQNEWLRKHNCDKKWWINVMDQEGQFGVLQVSHDFFKKGLEVKLKEWRDNNKIDVFHPINGLWLKFTRTGSNPRVTDSVDLLRKTVVKDGEEVEVKEKAPMTMEQLRRAVKICPDLDKDCVTFLSVEKMQALIDSKGDLDKVDEIWDGPKAISDSSSSSSDGSAGDTASETLQGKQETPAEPPKDKAPSDDLAAQEAALEAQMAALRARRAAGTTTSPPKEEKQEAPAGSSDDAEDFLSNFSVSDD